MWEDKVCAPAEVLFLYILCRKSELDTVTFHWSYISIRISSSSANSRGDCRSDEVIIVTFIPIECQIDPVIKETNIPTDIQFMFLFIGQFAVLTVCHKDSRFLDICKRAVGRISSENSLWVCYIGGTAVGCQWIRNFQSEVWKSWFQLFEKVFFMSIPCSWQVPGGEPTCRVTSAHAVGSFITECPVHGITPVVRIGHVGKCGHTACQTVFQRIIFIVCFQSFLEKLIYIGWSFTHWVLHPPTIEHGVWTAEIIDFHSSESIGDMLLGK